jgi:CXXX repeat modification system protein
MFASLHAETTAIIGRSAEEFRNSLWSAGQIDDISFNDFTSALRSLYEVIDVLMKGSTEVPENLILKYENLIQSAPKSQKQLYSYEQFAKGLEEIFPKTEATTKETGEFNHLISQYESKPVRLALKFRKTFFFEQIKHILLGLVEITEAARKHSLPLRSVSDNGKEKSISDVKEGNETVKLLLSKQEVESIRQIYETLLGWESLHEHVVDLSNQGFEINKEIIEVAQKEISGAKKQMDRWFNQAGKQHGWAVREGYAYAIDFEYNHNISSAYYKKISHRNPEQKMSNWIPVMQLDGIEREVIDRLIMLKQTSLAMVKELLIQHLAGLDVGQEMELFIQTLGQNEMDYRRWYFGMAKEFSWPPFLKWRFRHDRIDVMVAS